MVTLENIIDSLLGEDVFIVRVVETMRQNRLKLIIDAERDISLDETAEIAKEIRNSEEIRSLYPDGIKIEVSTPGISAPLELSYQYKKNIGRKLKLFLYGDSNQKVVGILSDVKDEGIHLNSNGHEIIFYSFEEIRKATVQVSF